MGKQAPADRNPLFLLLFVAFRGGSNGNLFIPFSPPQGLSLARETRFGCGSESDGFSSEMASGNGFDSHSCDDWMYSLYGRGSHCESEMENASGPYLCVLCFDFDFCFCSCFDSYHDRGGG